MKTTNQPTNRTRGSALVITMSVVSVAVMVLATYLMTVQSQVASVSRSQTWNQSISLAEAGMDEGMSMINYGAPSIIVNAYAWTNMLTTAGWTITGGTNASVTRYVSGSNYYIANISWSSTNAPTMSCAGVVNYTPIPWVFSAARAHSFLAAGGTGTNTGTTTVTNVTMGRKIQVSTVLSPLFSAGIVCKTNFDMNGQGCTVDSFDSSTSTYSTAGQWDATKRKANGNVATDSVLTSSLSLGNGNIYGSVYTGPGTVESCVSIGPNGTVGDLAWVSNHNGIQTNHWFGNFNMYIPDVGAPDTNGWKTSLPTATNSVILLNGGNYVVSSLPGTTLLISNTTVTVWIQSGGSISLPTLNFTNNGQLILYVGTTSGSATSLFKGGTINSPGYAANLQIYGLPSLTSVDFHGNAAWVGALYAPEASFVGGGGGNNNQDTSGALVVNSVSLKGHWNFHYDESLAVSGPSRGWVATGWKEVPYNP